LTLLPRAILHDETVFVEPKKFKPERFIDNDLPDPADSGVFGFGRRYVGRCSSKRCAIITPGG
jgi:cytochrome P450